MMIAGPALVDFAMPGPHYDKNELGGSHVHVTNGAIDDEAAVRGRGVRAGPPLPVVPADVGRRAAAARGQRRRSRAPRGGAAVDRAAQPAPRLQDASHHRGDRRSREPTAHRRSSRSAGNGASRSSPASPASTDGPSRCSPRTRTSTAAPGRPRRRRRSRALIDLASHLPPAARASRRLPGLPHRAASPSRRARSATGRGHSPRSARARRRTARWSSARRSAWPAPRTSKARQLPLPLRVAVGRLGLAADRGRHRGGLQGRARGGAPTETRTLPRSRARLEQGALAVPERRSVRHRGHHRSARHASPRVPVGRPRRARATTRTGPGALPPVSRRVAQRARASSSRSTPQSTSPS